MCATTIERGGNSNILGDYEENMSYFIERNRTYNENDRNLMRTLESKVFSR